MLIDTTEGGHDQKCCPGRDTDAPALGTWNLQIGNSQKSFYTKSNMSIESLNTFFTTSGEYISIHSKPWIISTTKEKEVTSLQYAVKLELYIPTFYKIRYILEELYVAVMRIISRLIICIDQLNTADDIQPLAL